MTQRENPSSADNQQERLLKLSPDYIVGLVDGEGYFSICPRLRKFGNSSREVIEVGCVFGIELKEQDKLILERVQREFNCGKLYFRRDNRENFCNLWAYRVRTHGDLLEKILPFFTAHKLQFPSKMKSFKRFKRVLNIIGAQEHQTPQGFAKIKQIVLSGRILRGHMPSPVTHG